MYDYGVGISAAHWQNLYVSGFTSEAFRLGSVLLLPRSHLVLPLIFPGTPLSTPTSLFVMQ